MKKVYLVGAGPGDPELMTIKALGLVKKADVIIYDSLIPKEMLREAKPVAELIDVGKRMGCKYKKQEEINGIIIEKAKEDGDDPSEITGTVVRLKGGDPFMFGRGGEEAIALTDARVPYEVIPGVTSAVSVPEHAGIPVTHRKEARSVTVITGHTAEGSEIDYAKYAGIGGTLVFLMGLNNIPKIAGGLIDGGMSKDTPAAVISSGFSVNEKTVRGTLSDIEEKVKEAGLVSPAIIVVGDTTKYDFSGRNGEDLPVIGVCGSDGFSERMKERLQAKGVLANITRVMCLVLKVRDDGREALSNALRSISDYGYVLFASQNAIDMFFDICDSEGFDRRGLSGIKMAVVGGATAKWLKRYGYDADIIPEDYTIESLAGLMAGRIKEDEEKAASEGKKAPGKVLAIRAVKGNEILYDIFDREGIDYEKVMLYDSEAELTASEEELGALDWLIFGSGSGVDLFFGELEKETGKPGKDVLPEGMKIACIGEPTASALEKHGMSAGISAKKHTADELAGLLAEELGK